MRRETIGVKLFCSHSNIYNIYVAHGEYKLRKQRSASEVVLNSAIVCILCGISEWLNIYFVMSMTRTGTKRVGINSNVTNDMLIKILGNYNYPAQQLLYY